MSNSNRSTERMAGFLLIPLLYVVSLSHPVFYSVAWLLPPALPVFTQFGFAVILGCQNSLYSSLDANPYYFVNGCIITSLVGFPVDWPNLYEHLICVVMRSLIWPSKRFIWLRIINHWDYLYRKTLEFSLFAVFKIRWFISLDLFRAAT